MSDDTTYGAVITPLGMARIAALVAGKITTPILYMAVGTGTTKPTQSDGRTAMQTEVYRGVASIEQTGDDLVYSLSVPAGTVSTDTPITELALFDAATNGMLFARATRAPVTIGAAVGQTFKIPINLGGGMSE
jgi:hypothetical protein